MASLDGEKAVDNLRQEGVDRVIAQRRKALLDFLAGNALSVWDHLPDRKHLSGEDQPDFPPLLQTNLLQAVPTALRQSLQLAGKGRRQLADQLL